MSRSKRPQGEQLSKIPRQVAPAQDRLSQIPARQKRRAKKHAIVGQAIRDPYGNVRVYATRRPSEVIFFEGTFFALERLRAYGEGAGKYWLYVQV